MHLQQIQQKRKFSVQGYNSHITNKTNTRISRLCRTTQTQSPINNTSYDQEQSLKDFKSALYYGSTILHTNK